MLSAHSADFTCRTGRGCTTVPFRIRQSVVHPDSYCRLTRRSSWKAGVHNEPWESVSRRGLGGKTRGRRERTGCSLRPLSSSLRPLRETVGPFPRAVAEPPRAARRRRVGRISIGIHRKPPGSCTAGQRADHIASSVLPLIASAHRRQSGAPPGTSFISSWQGRMGGPPRQGRKAETRRAGRAHQEKEPCASNCSPEPCSSPSPP